MAGSKLSDQYSMSDWIERLVPQRAKAGKAGVGDEPEAAEHNGKARADVEPSMDRDTLLLSISRPAMACEFEVLLNQHQYPQGTEVAMQALDLIEAMERLFSIYKPKSDLSALNRFGAERLVPLGYDTLQLLQLAQAVHRWTNAAFDVTSGSLSEIWGFARRQGRRPDSDEITQALQVVGSHLVQLDTQQSAAKLERSGVSVNPGGIGKGYALDRAAGKLIEAGIEDFMIHGGLSSIVAHGHRQHRDAGGGWQVSLKHPWRWEQHLGTIRLRNGALGTSGSGKQFFHFEGKRYSHIIDPRSGWPAQGMMSATVLCRSAAISDALATALFVMGPQAAREFCQRHESISAVLVFQDEKSGKQQIETSNMSEANWSPAR